MLKHSSDFFFSATKNAQACIDSQVAGAQFVIGNLITNYNACKANQCGNGKLFFFFYCTAIYKKNLFQQQVSRVVCFMSVLGNREGDA